MGGKQSKLKKELATLKADAAAATTKHQEELEALRSEKRMLEFKLHALQEMTAKAQLEADAATQLALQSEEKMKALKWELVRRLSVPANKTPVSPSNSRLTSSTSSSIASLTNEPQPNDSATSAIPRVPVTWKLKEGVALRRSNTSFIPKTRPKAQSDPLDFKREQATAVATNATIHTFSKRGELIVPPTKSPASDSRTSYSGRISSNQDDAADAKQVVSQAAVPPAAVASSPAVSAPGSDFDKFAPVKRRSLNRDAIATPATLAAVEAQAKSTERVESMSHAASRVDDKAAKDSDSDRERSFKSNSSSKSEDSDTTPPAAKGRGVLAATKGMAPQASKATEDDVLALSDDEDD